MAYPISKQSFDTANPNNTLADYLKYVGDFLKAKGTNAMFTPESVKKLRKHSDIDDLVTLYNMNDAMEKLPTKAKVSDRQAMLVEYFNGRFTKVEAAPIVVEAAILPTDSREAAALKTMFSRFEQSLYNEGTVGTKAREDIIDLMILRMLEPYFTNGSIDIMDVEKYAYDDLEVTKENINRVLMHNLTGLKTEEIRSELRRIWTNVLCVHPLTRQIFNKEKFLNIKSDSGLQTMVADLCSFNFETCPIDVLGGVYEHFIHKQFKGEQGSKLGQHFTPRKIVRFIVDNFAGGFGEGEKFIDPFSGTGGFVMEFYNRVKSEVNNTADAYLYASEIDQEVFKYAKANSIIYTKTICPHIIRTSAFEPEHVNNRFTRVLTNPPFGMKFTDKDSYNKTTWFNQAKTKNGNMICLQYNMHILAEGGICSMVWPYGSECFSSSKKAEVEIRKRLFTEFDVINVILLPKGAFEYTSIATVILTFRKPRAGEAVVSKLKMLQYKDGAKSVDELETIVEADAVKLVAKKYVIDPNAYKEVVNVARMRPIFEMKRLGDVCEVRYGTRITKTDAKEGTIPVYGGGDITFYHNEHNRTGVTLLVSRFGVSRNCTRVVSGDIFLNDSCMSLHPINERQLLPAYLNYYVCSKSDTIYEMCQGTAQKNISMEALKDMLIPIPGIEFQNEIVQDVSRLESGISSIKSSIKGLEFMIELAAKKHFTFPNGAPEMKRLGDVCDFRNGSNITAEELHGDKYPVIGGGVKPMGCHDEFNTPANTILVSKDGAYAGYVSIHNIEVFATSHCIRLYPKDVNKQFVYYFLKHTKQEDIYKLQTGAAQPGVNSSQLAEIMIPVLPSTEQLEFVEFYKNRELKIEAIKKDITVLQSLMEPVKRAISEQFE
jgi:restriction endonuclease S subunit/16S rRNA G966 N2-methylase RsmD